MARSAPWLLVQLSKRYGSVVGAQLGAAGLGGLPRPAYWLLMALASGAGDATRLVEVMGVTKQAVSRVVDALVGEGFLSREINAEDRRRTDLVLTDKGLETVGVIRSAVRTVERTFVGEVGEPAWNTTVETLAVLARRGRADRTAANGQADEDHEERRT
ncbi:MAG TPA: MarR family transcriptional regulator [Acidimicrobiales bacterium]|nr:MarR family transcriptional regulator [Acidimicrobiales bacterium]